MNKLLNFMWCCTSETTERTTEENFDNKKVASSRSRRDKKPQSSHTINVQSSFRISSQEEIMVVKSTGNAKINIIV